MLRRSKYVRTKPLARQPHVSPTFSETSLLELVAGDTLGGAAVLAPTPLAFVARLLLLDAIARVQLARRIRV